MLIAPYRLNGEGGSLVSSILYILSNTFFFTTTTAEQMLIALYRLNGEGGFTYFDEVCKLCRNTGYIPGPGTVMR